MLNREDEEEDYDVKSVLVAHRRGAYSSAAGRPSAAMCPRHNSLFQCWYAKIACHAS